MKVINYTDILPVTMDNDMVKNVAGRLLIGREDGANNFSMRLFEMGSKGHTPKHSHPWEHEVFVHKGTGEVFMDGQWHSLSEGSAIFVPPNVEHQFRNTADKDFAFVCLVPPTAPEL
ncbi:MAG: cupin domain-containing protein [Proteobacteria bacterium]|nr:cupin domain-containing protein [Desulfobacula sp.]MBU3953407.1 cupin domain-containing protein [Pseudomonadota bacterium]MBU4132020.1 cupin domain-containing protein [Pseudomonadota bacterium]